MELGFKNKVALVAGASSGVGKAIAECFADEGAKVAILSRSLANLKDAAKDIKNNTGHNVLPVKCDVTNKKQIELAVSKVTKKLGKIDILVCNAGGPPTGTHDLLSDKEFDISYALNLKSTIRLTQAVLPQMKEQGWGRIINITSVSAIQPIDNLMLSNTMRSGVHGFTKTLSNEIAADGITVNCICPGFTNTDRLQHLANSLSQSSGKSAKTIRKGWTELIPAKRLADPLEIGYLASFLASDKAAYITGLAINIDGGYVKSI